MIREIHTSLMSSFVAFMIYCYGFLEKLPTKSHGYCIYILYVYGFSKEA
jgi:hypothetical protein